MTKQEEIAKEVILITKSRPMAYRLLRLLRDEGVMVKVKCPNCGWIQFVGEESVGMTPCHSCNSTGYLIEPLIEEVKE